MQYKNNIIVKDILDAIVLINIIFYTKIFIILLRKLPTNCMKTILQQYANCNNLNNYYRKHVSNLIFFSNLSLLTNILNPFNHDNISFLSFKLCAFVYLCNPSISPSLASSFIVLIISIRIFFSFSVPCNASQLINII